MTRKSSGSLNVPDNEISTEGFNQPTGRKRNISLAEPPRNGDVPTLAADLNTAMMGPDMVKTMDDQYAERLRTFSVNHGYYASSQFSSRPGVSGRALQEEAETRKEMAKSIQRYMIVRGIPKFLATKPDTKAIAKTYNNVVVMSKIEGKTKSRWEYKTGLNPFQLRAFGNVSKDGWFFETSTLYQKGGKYYLKDVYFNASKSYSDGSYSTGCTYELYSKMLTPNAGHRFNKALTGNLAYQMPLGATYVMENAVALASMNYNF